jgi:hypothetical protein
MPSKLTFSCTSLLLASASALLIREESPNRLSTLGTQQKSDVSPLRAWAHKKLKSKTECFQTVRRYQFTSLTQFGQEYQKRAAMPGAGIGEIVPFKTVLKDGFLPFGCLKDEMYYHGDKYHDNRHAYTMESMNLSVVFYDAVVPKHERQPMTPDVCFDFCRTVPDMGFFGIFNGRNCYCEPYFKRMAGDDAACTSVCEGEPTQMCGSDSKSAIFEMHMCADTVGDINKAIAALDKVNLANVTKKISSMAKTGAKESNDLMELLSKLGDSAYKMLQKAAFQAGDLEKLVAKAEKMNKETEGLKEDAKKLMEGSFLQTKGKPDFSDYDTAQKAEELIRKMEAGAVVGQQVLDELDEALKVRSKLDETEASVVLNRSAQYYHAYYFSNPEPHTGALWGKDKSTCSGNLIAPPIFSMTLDECAYECDEWANHYQGKGRCTSFFHMAKSSGICFLYNDLDEITHYDMCQKGLEGECAPSPIKKSSLLEKSEEDDAKDVSTPFPWKTKSEDANSTLYKESIQGMCVSVDGCGGGGQLSDCSLMKSYECEEYDETEIVEEGGVLKMSFSGWLADYGGDKNNACSVNPVPCETCKKYKTCSGPFAVTQEVQIKKGDVASYTWTSSGAVDSYEVFVGLYSKTCGLVDFQLQRGAKQPWKTFELYAPKTDKYYVKFLLSSYDWTGGGAIGADMQVKEVKQTKATIPRVFSIESKCMAKFSEFSGVPITPDPSGMCKKCLKKATKRCLKPDGTFPTPEDLKK